MLGPFATARHLTPIHQMSLAVLSRAACASMSTTTTTTTTRDRGDRYGPMEWAQSRTLVSSLHTKGRGTVIFKPAFWQWLYNYSFVPSNVRTVSCRYEFTTVAARSRTYSSSTPVTSLLTNLLESVLRGSPVMLDHNSACDFTINILLCKLSIWYNRAVKQIDTTCTAATLHVANH